MIAKTALSILALSTSLGIGFASEDVSAGIQKKKLTSIQEKLFQDSWEFSTGNLSYYQSFF